LGNSLRAGSLDRLHTSPQVEASRWVGDTAVLCQVAHRGVVARSGDEALQVATWGDVRADRSATASGLGPVGSHAPSELVLHLWARLGYAGFRHLDGSWAAAILNTTTGSLVNVLRCGSQRGL
jgi:hypothetical protein